MAVWMGAPENFRGFGGDVRFCSLFLVLWLEKDHPLSLNIFSRNPLNSADFFVFKSQLILTRFYFGAMV
jgi:hypothetical protein